MRFVATDICAIFKSAVRQALPAAELVVDHCHLVQMASATVTEVRCRVTVRVRGRRGRKGNREWELRNRLRLSRVYSPRPRSAVSWHTNSRPSPPVIKSIDESTVSCSSAISDLIT
ncbi:hypothetical protein Cci01nite_83070 [Catellatospora citrea]|uniref:Transposase IS204/IS1001/IS1096/IS1165 DDE domain-containing protein n=1 Tax=Catellatospora citrea TaxID=53366 RepID=A0A8J3P4B8_9ACTN|nr:hypothetical protein Cci01nite_83070 [Catellatospora citrea]